MRNAVELSSPDVGSSNNSRLGSVINSYPMQVRFRSPPEIDFKVNPPILVSLQDVSCSLWIRCSAFYLTYSSLRFVLSRAAKQNDSNGVKVSINISSYMTNAPNLPKSPFFSSLLLHLIVPLIFDPLLKSNLCPKIFNKLVLPEPLAPMIATISPGLTYPVTLFKICLSSGERSSK